MFGLDKIDFQRLAVTILGAAMLSSLCIGAAVGPAEAAGTVVPVGQPLVVTHA